jgi:hypothetical protein
MTLHILYAFVLIDLYFPFAVMHLKYNLICLVKGEYTVCVKKYTFSLVFLSLRISNYFIFMMNGCYQSFKPKW